MGTNLATLQTAVSSVIAGAISGITVRRSASVLTIEETPGVNVAFPEQELSEEYAVGESTFSFLSTYSVGLECYAWGEDRETSWVATAALVRSVTNVLRLTANRQLNGAALQSRVQEGSPLDPQAGAIGFMTGYGITLEADIFEGQL